MEYTPVTVEIPIVITDINLNEHWEVVLLETSKEYVDKYGEGELFIGELRARRSGIFTFSLKSGSIYMNENVLKIKVKGRKAVKA